MVVTPQTEQLELFPRTMRWVFIDNLLENNTLEKGLKVDQTL